MLVPAVLFAARSGLVPRRAVSLTDQVVVGHRPSLRPAARSLALVVVTIRLFAMLRERAGAREIELELPEGARVRDALDRLDDLAGGLPLVMAGKPRHPGARARGAAA